MNIVSVTVTASWSFFPMFANMFVRTNSSIFGCDKLISDLFPAKYSTWLPHFGMSYVFVFANVTTWSMQINQNFIVNHFLRCWVRHFTEGNVHCDGTGIYGWTIKQDRKVATKRLIEQAVVKFYYLSTSLLQLFLRFFSDDVWILAQGAHTICSRLIADC